MGETLLLPPRELVPKPDADDPIDYYYKPLTARLYRARLEMAVDLLGVGRYPSLLEVGFGSGIFLPELAEHTDRLVAVDIHPESARVEEMLRRLAIEAELRQASLFELPFEDAEFHGLVCVSVLEHLTELDRALDELRRVLRPGGVAVLGYPVRNPLTDAFFRLARYNPREIHPSSHADILAAAERHPGFDVDARAHFRRSCRPRSRPMQAAGAVPAETGVVTSPVAPEEAVVLEDAEIAEFFDGFAAVDDRWRRRNRGYYELLESVYRFLRPARGERPRDRLRQRRPPGRAAPARRASASTSARAWSSSRARDTRGSSSSRPPASTSTRARTFDYIVLSDVVPYAHDLVALLENLRRHSHARTRVDRQLLQPALAAGDPPR